MKTMFHCTKNTSFFWLSCDVQGTWAWNKNHKMIVSFVCSSYMCVMGRTSLFLETLFWMTKESFSIVGRRRIAAYDDEWVVIAYFQTIKEQKQRPSVCFSSGSVLFDLLIKKINTAFCFTVAVGDDDGSAFVSIVYRSTIERFAISDIFQKSSISVKLPFSISL